MCRSACYGVRYCFCINNMLGSSLPQLLMEGSCLIVLIMFACVYWCQAFCHVICLYVFISVLWCPLCFPHKTIFCSSLPRVVCSRAHVFCVCLVCSGVQHVMTMRETWWVYYKRLKLFTLRKYLGSLRFLLGSMLLIFVQFSVVCFWFVCLSSVFCELYVAIFLDCPSLIIPFDFL